MLDDWTVPVVVAVLSIIGFFIYSLGKSRDKSIFTKPTYHTEIKTLKRFQSK